MNSNALFRFISLWLILLLTTATIPIKTSVTMSQISKKQNDAVFFNPRQYFNKQCGFCHNKVSIIAPSMNEIKAVYITKYPKKEDFVKHMTAFVLNPNVDNRLIKKNLKKYKVMPSGMFYDALKIQRVVTYIYDSIKIPKDFKPKTTDTIKIESSTYKPKTIEAKIKLQKGVDICKILNLKAIDFEYAKTNIHPAMAKQLDNLVHFLKTNPKINIEIRNHTDSRGTAQHNLKLSIKRANAIKQYLIKHGISYKRITTKGYGESNLLNRCKDGVPCTEAEHAQNRRTELIIR